MKTSIKLLASILLLSSAISTMAIVPCVTNCVLTVNAALQTEFTPGILGNGITNISPNVWSGVTILWDDQPCETAPPQGAAFLVVWVSGNQRVDTKIGSIHIDCSNGKSSNADLIIPAYTGAAIYWFKSQCSLGGNQTCVVSVCRLSQPDRAPNPEQ